MRSTSFTHQRQSRPEMFFNELVGIRSGPPNLIPPEAFVTCENWTFQQPRVLETRDGSRTVWADNDSAKVHETATITIGINQYLVYIRGRKLIASTGASSTELQLSGNPLIFSNSTTVRDLCVFNNKIYAVDGTDKLTVWDGTTVTQLTVPDVATYGNPVSIVSRFGFLGTVTDKSYFRYTTPGSDTVWEERILLPGTITGTSGTNAITGTGTVFTNLETGTRILLITASGTTFEYLTVSNIVNNTSIQFTTNLVSNYAAGSLIYVIVDANVTPIDRLDGLTPATVRAFGNYFAVSKYDPSGINPSSKLLILAPLATNNDASLTFNTQSISGTFSLHPFSLAEYLDVLLFLTDSGLFAVQPADQDIRTVRPILLSGEKLDDFFLESSVTRRVQSRIRPVIGRRNNRIFIHIAANTDTAYCDTLLSGMEYEPLNFEFTALKIPTSVSASGQSFIHYFSAIFKENVYLLTDQTAVLLDPDLTYDIPRVAVSAAFKISSTTILASSALLCSAGYSPQYTTTNTPIQQNIRFGTVSNELFNNLTIWKFYLVLKETAPLGSIFPEKYYNILLNLDDGEFEVSETKNYEASPSFLWTADQLGIFTADQDSLFTADQTNTTETQFSPIEWFFKVSRFRTVSLVLKDLYTTGRLSCRGYGFIVKPSRYV